MTQDNFLKFKPIKKFISGVGADTKKYFGKNKGCIVCLGDDGFFYGSGLHQWLKKGGAKNVELAFMDDDGNGLEEKKIKGTKVLIVDNDIVSGRAYKKAMSLMRQLKEKLNIKDIKYATLTDRIGVADFSVEGYSAYAPWTLEQLDIIDLQIIKSLSDEGRKSFVEIARETGLSNAGVKNRINKLKREDVLKIKGGLNMEKFYSVSAHIEIGTDKETASKLIEKFKKSPLVYHLAKTSGRYNLIVSIAALNLEAIEGFIEQEIRSEEGVRHIEINVGELPIIPDVWRPPIS